MINEQYEMYQRCYVCCAPLEYTSHLLVRCYDCRGTMWQGVVGAYPIHPLEWERNG